MTRMLLLFLQFLVITCLAESRQGKEVQDKRRRKVRLLSYQDQVRIGKESQVTGSDMLAVEPSLFEDIMEQDGPFLAAAPGETESLYPAEIQKPRERKVSRLNLPPIQLHLESSLGGWGLPDSGNFPPEELRNFFPPHPSDKRNTEPTNRKNAKKFWNHFLLRGNLASEDLTLPMRTVEMQQENCRTLPFSQSILHESCEKVVVENNLCFGKCSSFHVPGPADHLYTFCSHCLPTKFTMHRLEMNCTGATTMVKVVMVVEECKCEIQRGKHPQPALLQANLDLDVPDK